jgi:hypothetical protein
LKVDRNKNQSDSMELTRLDEILATDDELVPSSGFLTAVMERVEEESRAPAPIPFPWKRALPGFMLAAGVFGWAGVEFARWVAAAMSENLLAAPHLPSALVRPMEQLGWVALALGASLASSLLARRLTGRSGLL